jgi:PilZ domain-containing protein
VKQPAHTPGAHSAGHHTQVKRGNTTRNLTAEERRRAQRVLLRININIQLEGKTNVMHGQTHTVSENGGMLILSDSLPENAKISIENARTQKKVDARVVRQGQHTSEGFLVPVEFLAPSPAFWSVFFPPVVN